MTAKKPPQNNHLYSLVIKITEPFKMDTEMEVAKIMLLVGANGTGKTFLLKIAYALSSVGASKDGPVDPIPAAQFVFDNVFTEQNITGTLKAIYGNKGHVSVELDKGKVVNVEMVDLVDPALVVYMSSELRTFDQMNLYLRVRKNSEGMSEILQSFRLYDLTYMEALIAMCPIPLGTELMKTLKSEYDFKEAIKTIDADLDNCSFNATLEDGSKKNLATYGKGHQAILNMFIGTTTAGGRRPPAPTTTEKKKRKPRRKKEDEKN